MLPTRSDGGVEMDEHEMVRSERRSDARWTRWVGGAVAGMLLLPPVATGTAAAAGSEATRATEATTTTVRLVVNGCEGCTITPVGRTATSIPGDVVEDGRAVLRIPTASTPGVLFAVDDPRSHTGATPMVVMRYAGTRKGQRVRAPQAAQMRRGTGCWAGTKARQVTLKLTARTFSASAPNGEPTRGLRIWASQGQRVVGGTMAPTPAGVLASQAVPSC